MQAWSPSLDSTCCPVCPAAWLRRKPFNTSSVNGLWASLGPTTAHTAYSAAKFAARGFTEALISDVRVNAPHLRAHVVMPGHIGTGIAINSSRILGRDPKELDAEQLAQLRARLDKSGIDTSGATDDDLRLAIIQRGEAFRDNAPMSAAESSTVILDGVRAARWRILVGSDAAVLDTMVRETPETILRPGLGDPHATARRLRLHRPLTQLVDLAK